MATFYVETPDENYSKDMPAIHFGAKYWGFYLGWNSYHSTFNGKFGYTTVRFG